MSEHFCIHTESSTAFALQNSKKVFNLKIICLIFSQNLSSLRCTLLKYIYTKFQFNVQLSIDLTSAWKNAKFTL